MTCSGETEAKNCSLIKVDLPVPRAPNKKKLLDFEGFKYLGIILPNSALIREYSQEVYRLFTLEN